MHSRRHFIRTSLYFVGSLLGTNAISACTTSTAPLPTNAANGFKVALLLPGPKDDGSWNQTGYEGSKLIEQELQANVSVLDSVPPEEFEQHFGDYAEQGYDLIIGHGGQFVEAAEAAAEKHPRSNFAVITPYGGNNRNLGAIAFRDSEMGYLSGALAALVSKTQKVAYVGGEAYETGKTKAAFFKKGAQAVNSSIIAEERWLETWSDTSRGSAIGEELLKAGFDVMAVDADSAGLPIHQQAAAAGTKTIGWATDQNKLSPETIISSGIQDVARMMLQGASIAQKGQWQGTQYKFGLAAGVQSLAPSYGTLSDEHVKRIEDIQAAILRGEIDLTLSA